MFDFINYTYSGMLAIVAAVFGIAYPQINCSIERVDDKYHSSMLTARFRRQISFVIFKVCLIVNLCIVVLNPFFLDESERSYLYITIQSIATIFLIASFFLLYQDIQLYNDASKLHNQIWLDFKKHRKTNQKIAAKTFKEWIDLAGFILCSSDKDAGRNIYDNCLEYISEFYEEHKYGELTFDRYIYDGISHMNMYLCKDEHEPISINNENSFLTMFLLPYCDISENTYSMLWSNLRFQMYYGREEWIMSYWEQASQFYDICMQHVSEYDINRRTNRNYTTEDIEKYNNERKRFLEFHIMLCAMFLRQKKYELVRRILSFTQSKPPTYPLIPSTLPECLKYFSSIHNLYESTPFVIEQRYPMPQLRGLSGGKILGTASLLMALLVYRLYTLPIYTFGVEHVFSLPIPPDNSLDIQNEKDNVSNLKRIIDYLADKPEYLKCIELDNLKQRIEKINQQYGSSIESIDCYLDNYLKELDSRDKDLKINQQYSKSKVEGLNTSIADSIKNNLLPYKLFLKKNPKREIIQYLVDGSIFQLFPNQAFVDNASVSYVDVDSCMSHAALYKFRHYFATTFMEKMAIQLNIDSQNLFDAIGKVNLDAEKHILISFDVYWKYFLDKIDGLKKLKEGVYSYKNISIYNYRCGSKYLANYIYILEREEIPSLIFKEPSTDWKEKYGLECYNKDYNIWLGLQRLVEHKELVSEEMQNDISGNPDEQSLFACSLISNVIWKKNVKLLCIKVMHQGVDNGNSTNVEEVKPFDIYFDAKTNR